MNDLTWLPEALRVALGNEPTISDLGDELCVQSTGSPAFYIIRVKGNPLTHEEAAFILSVLAHREGHIETALRFIEQGVAAPAGVPSLAADPFLIFRGRREFEIHFQSCGLPGYGNGVLVSFDSEIPVSMESIEDPEAWWDEDSGQWVPA